MIIWRKKAVSGPRCIISKGLYKRRLKKKKKKETLSGLSNRISASPLCPRVSFFTQLLQSLFMCTEGGGKKPLSRAGPEVCAVISICTVALRHSETQPMTAGFLCQVVCFQTWSGDLAYFRRSELLTLYWVSCKAGSKALWCLCVILRIQRD